MTRRTIDRGGFGAVRHMRAQPSRPPYTGWGWARSAASTVEILRCHLCVILLGAFPKLDAMGETGDGASYITFAFLKD